ncbi:putative cAMP-specific phosphodiesterase [Paratrimastix pyriformis]|uniref:cAMP-specific phosphodiesterase n=1 Tax=Paratrimastix pyriformis TaxID=342808 RepID=A0ABQ8UTM4_9EUKA|nr:putative cAMP-specific phosphodiesterase [Paratrimastix pyriformis]
MWSSAVAKCHLLQELLHWILKGKDAVQYFYQALHSLSFDEELEVMYLREQNKQAFTTKYQIFFAILAAAFDALILPFSIFWKRFLVHVLFSAAIFGMTRFFLKYSLSSPKFPSFNVLHALLFLSAIVRLTFVKDYLSWYHWSIFLAIVGCLGNPIQLSRYLANVLFEVVLTLAFLVYSGFGSHLLPIILVMVQLYVMTTTILFFRETQSRREFLGALRLRHDKLKFETLLRRYHNMMSFGSSSNPLLVPPPIRTVAPSPRGTSTSTLFTLMQGLQALAVATPSPEQLPWRQANHGGTISPGLSSSESESSLVISRSSTPLTPLMVDSPLAMPPSRPLAGGVSPISRNAPSLDEPQAALEPTPEEKRPRLVSTPSTGIIQACRAPPFRTPLCLSPPSPPSDPIEPPLASPAARRPHPTTPMILAQPLETFDFDLIAYRDALFPSIVTPSSGGSAPHARAQAIQRAIAISAPVVHRMTDCSRPTTPCAWTTPSPHDRTPTSGPSSLGTAAPSPVLVDLAMRCMDRLGLLTQLGIDPGQFERCLTQIHGFYNQNPYHNAMHAADVMQAMYAMLTRGGLRKRLALSPLETLGCMLAAIIHDVEHPGVTASLLVNSHSPASLLYGQSVMESHHSRRGWELMCSGEYAFLDALSAEQFETMHQLVDTLVLGTDVANHTKLLALFAEKRPWIVQILNYHSARLSQLHRLRRRIRHLEKPAASPDGPAAAVQVSSQPPSAHASPPRAPLPLSPRRPRTFSSTRKSHLRLECTASHSSDDDDELPARMVMGDSDQAVAEAMGNCLLPSEVRQLRHLVLVVAIKAADVSNPARPWHLASMWSDQVMEEFYLQGDLEEQMGLPRSKNMDRSRPEQKPACQTGFIDFLAAPAFRALADVLPSFECLSKRVAETRQHWVELTTTTPPAPSPAAARGVVLSDRKSN